MAQKPRWAEIALNHPREANPIPIVGDGAIAGRHVGDGRLLPVVICDTSDRPDVAEHIRLHQHLPPGDVQIQWGKRDPSAERVALILNFSRPTELIAIIEFDIADQGVLVDQMLRAGGFHLQAGKPGDRVRNTVDAPKIIVEVADTDFQPAWEEMWLKSMTKKARRQGADRKDAQRIARTCIDELRKFGAIRMGKGS